MLTQIKPTRPFSDELLTRYRQQGDAPADAGIAAVVEQTGPAGLRTLMQWLANTSDFSTAEQHPAVQDFFVQYADLPPWANPDRMQQGMAFFKKYTAQISLILGLYSLPFTYLGANGAQVLWLTERIKNDTARRLQETGEWVYAVNNAKEWQAGSLPDNGVKAIARTLKIRLIHAGARWFSLHSGRWNMDWGHPVNQEDMAGTNIAFSYIVLLGIRKLGITTSGQEEEDYLHHTGVVNAILGVADELIPQNLREAYTLNQAISQRQFTTSEAGIDLTRSLLDAIAKISTQTQTNSPAKTLPETIRNLAAAEMRFFLGDTYANWLGIPNRPVEQRLARLLNRLPIFPNQFPGF